MDQKHRNIIQKNRERLEKLINLNYIENSLRNSNIFTFRMLEDISSFRTSLFEELPTRGPDAFDKFIRLLFETGFDNVAQDLCKGAAPVYNLLVSRRGKSIILHNGGRSCNESEEAEKLNSAYDAEAKAFDCALPRIGYPDPQFENDLADKDLFSILTKFSQNDFSGVDSCIVIILSRGLKSFNSDVIYGNGKHFLCNKILNLFSDSKCPSLMYKPKIFLLPSFDAPEAEFVINFPENVELLPDINDTFIWHFPPADIYHLLFSEMSSNCYGHFFGEILCNQLENGVHKMDFETIINSAYREFLNKFKSHDNVNINTHCVKLGDCKEKISFLN